MSIKMSAGCRSWARRTPSSPVSASMVWYPLTCSVSRTSFKFLGLSSTIKITSLAMAHRQRERERRAHTLLTLHPDSTTVELHKLPAQGESQARALHLLGRRPHLAELLEDLLLILGSDADSGVADGDLHDSILWHCAHVDPSALGRELDRVGQQVQDDLPDLPLVRPNLAQSAIDVHLQGDASPPGTLADEG